MEIFGFSTNGMEIMVRCAVLNLHCCLNAQVPPIVKFVINCEGSILRLLFGNPFGAVVIGFGDRLRVRFLSGIFV